jgi:hypothetical protein
VTAVGSDLRGCQYCIYFISLESFKVKHVDYSALVLVPNTASRTSEDECKWYQYQMIYFPETIKQ